MATGRRTYAKRVENGVTSHEGAYSYDAAGRLAQVVDAATSATEAYTWYADGTLASYPGPGYTRRLDYDPEQRLASISHDDGGGSVQTAYEYGYGVDGGRRWSKDYAAGVQTWYPCGVACCAGGLVEQQAPLAGGAWTTSAQYLQGIGLVSRNGEFHHADPLGSVGVITNSSGAVVSNNLYDAFGIQRYSQGAAQTPIRQEGLRLADEGLLISAGGYSTILPGRDTPLSDPAAAPNKKPKPPSTRKPPIRLPPIRIPIPKPPGFDCNMCASWALREAHRCMGLCADMDYVLEHYNGNSLACRRGCENDALRRLHGTNLAKCATECLKVVVDTFIRVFRGLL